MASKETQEVKVEELCDGYSKCIQQETNGSLAINDCIASANVQYEEAIAVLDAMENGWQEKTTLLSAFHAHSQELNELYLEIDAFTASVKLYDHACQELEERYQEISSASSPSKIMSAKATVVAANVTRMFRSVSLKSAFNQVSSFSQSLAPDHPNPNPIHAVDGDDPINREKDLDTADAAFQRDAGSWKPLQSILNLNTIATTVYSFQSHSSKKGAESFNDPEEKMKSY